MASCCMCFRCFESEKYKVHRRNQYFSSTVKFSKYASNPVGNNPVRRSTLDNLRLILSWEQLPHRYQGSGIQHTIIAVASTNRLVQRV